MHQVTDQRTAQTRIRPENSVRWQAALDRAIANALDVLVATDGSAFVESSSTPGLLYAVSREACTCPAGQKGMICQHRACYLAQIGELPLHPEPSAVEVSCRRCFGNGGHWAGSGVDSWQVICPNCNGTGRHLDATVHAA